MASFIRIVKNYENICRLGQNIIKHKDLVRRCPPEKLSDEFRKQGKHFARAKFATLQENMAGEPWIGWLGRHAFSFLQNGFTHGADYLSVQAPILKKDIMRKYGARDACMD